MKTIISIFAILVLSCIIISQSFAQMTVPIGWETKDSIRFGMWGWNGLNSTATPYTDTIGVNFEMGWGDQLPSDLPGGRRVGISSLDYGGAPRTVGLTNLGALVKERMFYPSVGPLTGSASCWRYVDTIDGYSWHDNRYNVNDISPYAEFLREDSIVTDSFLTHSYNTGGADTLNKRVLYGNEGKVILGYSDKRNATDLLTLMGDTLFNNITDTSKLTNAILEFNINRDSIDFDSSAVSTADSIPLLRVQILFKVGSATNQVPVLPFVPFRTASNPNNHGWWKIVDTIITRQIYDSLQYSYRTQDSVNGALSHSWSFKQLHLTLTPPPLMQMDTIPHFEKANDVTFNLRTRYGGNVDTRSDGSALYSKISLPQHPDSLVVINTNSITTPPIPLLEMRILSTYRATVRIRSLSYHDALQDKFLYRKRYTNDSTHSLNADGTYGGLDDSVQVNVNRYANLIPTGVKREIEWIDYTDEWNYLSLPAVGLVDYFLAKRKMNAHVHEQFADWIEEFRRSRMSQNGKPPSMYENEAGAFYTGSNYKMPFYQDTGVVPYALFPEDYLYYGAPADLTHQWPLSTRDSLVGQLILARRGAAVYNTSDSIYAYHRYTDLFAGMPYLQGIPANKSV